MKKILFAITNLEIGGAEQVLVRLASKLSETYEITILTLYGKGIPQKELEKKVTVKTIYPQKYEEYSKVERIVIALKLKCSLWKKKIIQKYEIETYDTVISFLEGPMTELLQEVNSKKKIAWIHTDLTKHYPKRKYPALLKQYASYDHLIFVSLDSYTKFEKIDPNNSQRDKKQVIYNYVDQEIILEKSKEPIEETYSNELNFVVVARLVEAKGIDRLMKVHQRLIEENHRHHIYVIGDGPLKDSLLSQQKSQKIEETFHFLGQKKNPYPYMLKGDYLLLPSYYEGYPVTLIEGMILNKYLVVTDISSKEVLKDYPNHLIVENSDEGIYEGLKTLIDEKKRRPCLTYQDKRNEEILNQIETLLKEDDR